VGLRNAIPGGPEVPKEWADTELFKVEDADRHWRIGNVAHTLQEYGSDELTDIRDFLSPSFSCGEDPIAQIREILKRRVDRVLGPKGSDA